jgi:hypothetical protein
MNLFCPFEFIYLLESYYLTSERGEFIITDLLRFIIPTGSATYQYLKGAMLVGKTPFKAHSKPALAPHMLDEVACGGKGLAQNRYLQRDSQVVASFAAVHVFTF